MKRIALIAAVALAGCATKPATPPAVQVMPQRVEVPVATPCVDSGAVPAEPSRVGDRMNGEAAHDLDVVAGSAVLLRQWGRELRALITPCIRP